MSEQANGTEPRAKLGLALSGGGFRASFFHLGVFKRLAELDLLRHVEVLSTVSGGSIIAALYILILKREIENLTKADKGHLETEVYEKIVSEVEELFVKGVKKNLRTRLVMNPLRTLRVMLTSRSLGERMAGLYEKHLYASVIEDLRKKEEERSGNDLDWPKGSIPLTAVRFAPPGESFSGGLDAYNQTHDTKIPKFILNATCLNSGRNWRFTSVEVGDSLLGIIRADEIGQLSPRSMKKSGIDRPEWNLVPRLKAALEEDEYSDAKLIEDLKEEASPQGTSCQVLAAEYLIRHGRDVDMDELVDMVGPELLQAPLTWLEVGLRLEDLVEAEFGDLYRLKVEAWYLHRGKKSYRASGSENRFWAGLRRVGGDRKKVEELKRRVESASELRAFLMDFVIDLYYARIARVVGPDVGEDVGKISLADAVAASACFPPVFAPYSFLGLYDDRHVPIIRLTDGGVFDNQGLTALFEEECTHIIASDAGGLLGVQQRASGSRIPMMGRVISVLMGALRGEQLDHLREERRVATVLDEARSRVQAPSTTLEEEAEDHKLNRLAFFHMTSPPELGDAEGLPVHAAPDAVAEVRTDLDAFGDAEIGALVYQGYSLCDRFVRKYLAGEPYSDTWSPAVEEPTPSRLPDEEREQEILEVGSQRMFRALRLGVVEAGLWTAILAVLLIGSSWMVRLSVHDLADGAVWFLGLLQIDVESRVPLGLVIAVVLAVVGLRLLWPWAYGKLGRIRRAATAIKWIRAFSGSLLLFVLFLPIWIALVASLLALFSHWCHTRPFLRATKVPDRSGH